MARHEHNHRRAQDYGDQAALDELADTVAQRAWTKGTPSIQANEPSAPFEVRQDNTYLHENVEFTFLLGNVRW